VTEETSGSAAPERPSDALARRTRELRGPGSRTGFAHSLRAIGSRLDKITLSKIEAPSPQNRRRITWDEGWEIAAALDVSPLDLALPHDAETIRLTPGADAGRSFPEVAPLDLEVDKVRRWVKGRGPLDSDNTRDYFGAMPPHENRALNSPGVFLMTEMFDSYMDALGRGDAKEAKAFLGGLRAELERQEQMLELGRIPRGR
jgi:hypothetical protein